MSIAPLWGLIHGNSLDLENLGVPLNREGYYFQPSDPINPVIYSKGLVYAFLGLHQVKMLGLELPDPQLQSICNQMTFPDGSLSKKTTEELEDILLGFARKAEEYAKLGDWEKAFSIVEKRAGLTLYLKHFNDIPNSKKWNAFIKIYTRSEAGFEVLEPFYERIFEFAELSKKRNSRIKKLKKKIQSDTLNIYHGAKNPDSIEDPKDSYSWSLDIGVAEWFARRFGTDGKVYKATIPLREVVDYLTERNEEEILWNPKASEVKPRCIKTYEGGEWK